MGFRKNEPITLAEVKEVIPLVIKQGWLAPASRETYNKYLSGGNTNLLIEDFKGKGRLKALWDITGYALQEAMWISPTTKEMYLQQLAAFWSLPAPKQLPTLPGIGRDGKFYQYFSTPKFCWNSKYIETLSVRRILLDEEDESTPAPAPIVPKAVSKAPVIAKEPWDPILGDSVHAYAWWTLTKEELTAVIEDQKRQSTKRPASQITDPPPIAKGSPMPKGGAMDHPGSASTWLSAPPKEKPTAKAPVVKVPSISSELQNLQLPTIELPVPKRPQQTPSVEFRGNAGVRQPSVARGRKSTSAPTITDQQLSELPAFMAPLTSAMGLGHLPASQPMIQEMNESRTQGSMIIEYFGATINSRFL